MKDHLLEKESLSRRASQQVTNIMLKNRSRSKLFNFARTAMVLGVVILVYLQFSHGPAINTLMHSLDSWNSDIASDSIIEVDLSPENKLLDSILTIIEKNEPIFEEPISIQKDKLDSFQSLQKDDSVLSESKLIDSSFIKLTENQQNILLKSHSELFLDIFGKMHKLVKLYHQFFQANNNGLMIYNPWSLNYQESLTLSRLTLDSVLKLNTKLPVQIVFHHLPDSKDKELLQMCSLSQVSCINLNSSYLRSRFANIQDSFLHKCATLFSNNFDKFITVKSGTIFLNDFSNSLNLENNNFVFWSLNNFKRVTNPMYYTIADNNNVYGHRRERVRQGRDETLRYFALSEEQQKEEVAFHDLEDTLVNANTDSSLVIINKRTTMTLMITSMYYDVYNTIYYPLIMGRISEKLSEIDNSKFFQTSHNLKDNAFSETLILSSFVSNGKHYHVVKKPVAISNGFLSFDAVQDNALVNKYYQSNLRQLLPSSMETPLAVYDPSSWNNYIDKDLDIKPVALFDANYEEIFNMDKYFNNVFEHEFYLNNNMVDPDLILSSLLLKLRKLL